MERVNVQSVPELLSALSNGFSETHPQCRMHLTIDIKRSHLDLIELVHISKDGYLDYIRIAAFLAANPNLDRLSVRSCPSRLWMTLVEALKANRSISHLHLSVQKPNALLGLADTFVLKQNLRTLSLVWDKMNCSSVSAVVKSLKSGGHIRVLHLRGVLSDEAMITIAEVVKTWDGLQELVMTSDEKIEAYAGIIIAKALQNNMNLRTFRIGGRRIGVVGSIAMAEALDANDSLESFGIAGIGDVTAIAIAKVLRRNSRLRSVEMFGNFGRQACEAVADALRHNNIIREFAFQLDEQILPDGWEAHMSTDYGIHYFWNANTGDSCWDRPVGIPTDLSIAVAESLTLNTTLLKCSGSFSKLLPPGLLARNAEAERTWRALASLAKPDNFIEFGGLPNVALREAAFAFLLPANANWPFRMKRAQFLSTIWESTDLRPHECAPHQEAPMPIAGESTEQQVEQQVKMRLAMQMNEKQVTEREAADLAKAIQLSNADQLGEELVLLRLLRQARSSHVAELLQNAPELAHCRELVADLQPEWAGGAWLLAAIGHPQLCALLEGTDVQLQHHHVLVRQSDIGNVAEALKRLPKRQRPNFRLESLESMAGCHAQSDEGNRSSTLSEMLCEPQSVRACAENSESEPQPDVMMATTDCTAGSADATSSDVPYTQTSNPSVQPPFVIERTFLNVIEPGLVSEASDVCNSGPCGEDSAKQPRNPRRWIKR